jgi:hypothetical protein
MIKDYILTRLTAGENIDAIGQEIADMMNEAMETYNAKIKAEQKAKEKKQAKRDLVVNMIDNIKALAVMDGMPTDMLTFSEDEVDGVVEAFEEMFLLFKDLKTLSKLPPKKTVPVSDDEILADFIKMFK